MSDLLLMTMMFFMIAFTYLGLTSPYKIFSLIAGGVGLALIIELKDYTAIVVVLVGFIIWQVWYATIGGHYND